ncbi:UvrD-helicase domain-containing protein [bacterium]|nr:UvrD-helicase domain-containing protein [bacterium]
MDNKKLFKLFQASAGSGKTHTLVLEYLKLVFREPQKIGTVLAITFTNKAAYEMKERILRALKKGVNGEKDPIIEDLKGYYSEFDIVEKSKEILNYIIHNYTKFSIMTIDSFIHKIVSSYAFELNIPPNTNIIIEEDILLKKVVSFMFEKLNSVKDINITQIFKKMVETKIEGKKSWDIESDLRKLINELVREDGRKVIESIQQVDLNQLYLTLDKRESALINPIKTLIDDFLSILKINSINPDDLGKTKKHIPFFVKSISESFDSLKTDQKYSDFKLLEPDKEMLWRRDPKTVNKDDKVIFEKFDKLKQSKLQNLWEDIEKKYNTLLLILKTSDILREALDELSLLKEFYNIFEEYKKNNTIIPISDFNYIVKKIVTTEDIPFIFQKIGETYHNYLIDEFQDTSKIQWGNIFPLIENSMSERYSSLAVGDVKQAIYRWRGGDSEIMANLKDSIERVIPDSVESFTLNKNYRSSSNIIKFNNELFYFIKNGYLLDYNIYSDVKQEIINYNSSGYVEIDIFSPVIDDDNSYNTALVNKIIKEIKRLESIGVQLKNIAVLARKNSELSIVASALLENGIQAISSGSVLLRDEEVISFIINFLYYLQDNENIYAKYVILSFFAKYLGSVDSVESVLERYYQKSKESKDLESNQTEENIKNNSSDTTQQKKKIKSKDLDINQTEKNIKNIDLDTIQQNHISNNEKSEIYDYLESTLLQNSNQLSQQSPPNKNDLTEFIPQITDSIINDLTYLPLYDIVEYLIRLFNLNRGNKDGKTLNWGGFLEQFLNEIVKSKTKSISDFLFYWEENSEEIHLELPIEINAVQVMTIHKSKGLEFDYVFVPFSNWDSKLESNNIIWAKDSNIYRVFPEFEKIDKILFYKNDNVKNSFFSSAEEDEAEQVFIDNLNLLYVSFTRAKNSLYITFPPIDNKKEKKNSKTEMENSKNRDISNFIVEFIEHVEEKRGGFFKLESDMYSLKYTIGKRTEYIDSETVSTNDYNAELDSYDWKDRVGIMNSADRLWIRREKEPNLALFRELLIDLDRLDEPEPFLLKQWLFKGIIDEHQELLFTEKLKECKNYTIISDWYGHKLNVKKGYKISKNGKVYQCDRLIDFGDRVHVVTFINSFFVDKKTKRDIFYLAQTLSEQNEDIEVNGYIVKIPALDTAEAIVSVY